MAELHAHAGTKRPHTADANEPSKKQRVHRAVKHVQRMPAHVEPAPQDPIFAQGQLLRSISAALAVAGFDSVKPTALEMLRSHTEEYMLKLLSYVRVSMMTSRRTTPTAQDFSIALAQIPNAQTASLLKPQLKFSIPEDVACPSISEPEPPMPAAPDFTRLLAPLMDDQPPNYIPKHFPRLPPKHAWLQTPVFAERETDARKMREKATQEGMMAEQALRKLAAAAKSGALKAEKRRTNALSGPGKARGRKARQVEKAEDIFSDVLKEVGGSEDVEEANMLNPAETVDSGVDPGMPEGVVVNYDMGHWRRGRGRHTLRL
ncbi:Hypothetical protein R9X50_00408400 [Acrodontium crateriforme]|uniref:Transcription initiation factor TFIID subunit 8 n=1 Tax=Acrodontium crateriforme TaxID=150365 RepID=A0AAQ3MAD0_9PEZI|nr:Hypothetical protein R9X50_00408400 [Acrodontium crateriforme]